MKKYFICKVLILGEATFLEKSEWESLSEVNNKKSHSQTFDLNREKPIIEKDKKILIIDREEKTKNDRTWCFWEIGDNVFEEIIYRKWKTVNFKGKNFDKNLDIGNYNYKMLRGIDFYEFVFISVICG